MIRVSTILIFCRTESVLLAKQMFLTLPIRVKSPLLLLSGNGLCIYLFDGHKGNECPGTKNAIGDILHFQF